MMGSLSAVAQSRPNPSNWKQRMRIQENGHMGFHIPWKIIWPCFPDILKTIYSCDTPLTFVELIATDNTFQQHAYVASSDSGLTFHSEPWLCAALLSSLKMLPATKDAFS